MKLNLFLLLGMLVYFPTCIYAQWLQIGSDIEGRATLEYSGRSVALSDDGQIFAVATPSNEGAAIFRGYVDVYQLVNGVRQQLGQRIYGEGSNDHAGHEISLSGDGSRLAISAPYNDASGTNAGHVRVYEYDAVSSSWVQLGADIDGLAAGDQFGSAVCLSYNGNAVAIGAMNNDAGGTDAGQLSVFSYQNGVWVLTGQRISGAAAGYGLGFSVSINDAGSRVAVGGRLADGNGTNAGEVRVFDNLNGTWTQVGQTILGAAAGDYMGNTVTFDKDGSTLAVGAPLNDANGTDAGVIQVFKLQGGSWVQMGQALLGARAGDKNGSSVSLTSDGLMISTGAIGNDDNGTDAGHSRVYRYDNAQSSWVQYGQSINGQSANSLSGFCTRLSTNGQYLIVGAPYNDDNGAESGQSRLFRYNCSANLDLSISQSGNDLIANQANASYQWQSCNFGSISGANGQSFSPLSNGYYSVIISQNGCVDTSNCYSFILSSTSESELVAKDLRVFPNPSQGHLIIQTPKIEEVRLYNSLGQLVLASHYQNESQIELNLQQLPAAIYLLEVNTALGRRTQKVILSK